MVKQIILTIILTSLNLLAARAQYNDVTHGSGTEATDYNMASGISDEASEFAGLSQLSSLEDLRDFLAKYPSSLYREEVNNYIALNLAGEFCSLSTDKDYQEAMRYASGETIIMVQEAINQNEVTKKFIKSQRKSLRRKENGGWVNLVLEWANFTWNGRIQDGLFQYNFGIKLKIGNQADPVQLALGPKLGVGVWDFKRVYRGVKPGEKPNTRFKNFFQLPLEVELKCNLARLGTSTRLFLDGRFDYYAIRKKEVQRPMSVNVGIGFAGHAADFVIFYGRALGNIDSKYSLLYGYPNPFMDSRTANYFGLSVSWVL